MNEDKYIANSIFSMQEFSLHNKRFLEHFIPLLIFFKNNKAKTKS